MGTYVDRDLKLLLARSGGVCAFRGCKQELIVRGTDDIVGHIAHIVARSDAGPRSDSTIPERSRNSHENLVLLCPTHHAEIDSRSGTTRWSRDAILEMKAEHEQWVSECLKVGVPMKSVVSQFEYINVPRLSALAFLNGFDVDLSFLDGTALLMTCHTSV